jgi:two-component system sensor histidine kinase KdpD
MDAYRMQEEQETERFTLPFEIFEKYIYAVLLVAGSTSVMFLAGREVLGEGVIALLYLVPISWCTARWGRGPGIATAILSGLAFNFFFIPPFYTLYIGSLEGWLLLGIFLAVAIVIVGRIQTGLTRAQERERDAIFMYELSRALAGFPTAEAVARILSEHIQQVTLAGLVVVFVEWKGSSFTAAAPMGGKAEQKPGLVIPILAGQRLAGEIRLWQGDQRLPPVDDRLLQNFANQGAVALERARLAQNQVQKERQL